MEVATITPRELSEKAAAGESVELLDVRTPVEFREVHATLARNVPLTELDPAAVMAARNGSSHGSSHGSAEQPLYVICRSGGRGRQACERFHAAGFANVVNVEGGTLAWAEAGLPVVRGRKAVSLERQVRISAGLLILLGVALSQLVHVGFAGLAAFVGAGLVFAGVTDTCGMGLVLARMPWNQVGAEPAAPSDRSSAVCVVGPSSATPKAQ